MGNSVSNLKGTFSSQNEKAGMLSSSTASSEKTMIHPIPEESKKTSATSKNKSSILSSKNFFRNLRCKNKTRKDNTRSSAANINSLSRRSPNRDNREKIIAAITKSMIGKPTNFKHINSSTTQFNQMHFLQDDDDETSRIATQMSILSSMIKPLPDNNDNGIPVIPARTSSYGNDVYIKEFPIPETTIIATPSIKKNRKKVTGMKNIGGYTPGSITKRKHIQNHVRSTKKSR